MTVVTAHAPGVPSWIDLATPDVAAAKDFYAALFGWAYDDQPTDGPSPYVMASKDGHSAVGMMALTPEMASMPPVWSCYVTVADVEATLEQGEAAGGSVMRPAMDAMDAGRLAVVADPAGAVICLWQPLEHIGSEVINEPGAFSWAELITTDPLAVAPFYAAVFGWTEQTAVMSAGAPYTVFHVEGGSPDGIAGAMAPPVDGMPSFWSVYFQVADAAATVETARTHGATILMEATSMPEVGTLASIQDPHGAVFGVMQP